MKELADTFVELDGIIPEHIRGLVARRVAKALQRKVSTQDTVSKEMADAFARSFIKQCRLKEGDPVAPPKISVERSELAKFIDRWLHVQGYQDPITGDWNPISWEMNSLRVSMCAELLELGGFNPVEFGLR